MALPRNRSRSDAARRAALAATGGATTAVAPHYVPRMDILLLFFVLVFVLGVQYDLMKRAVFSALERHARNMAIREGTYDAERWQD